MTTSWRELCNRLLTKYFEYFCGLQIVMKYLPWWHCSNHINELLTFVRSYIWQYFEHLIGTTVEQYKSCQKLNLWPNDYIIVFCKIKACIQFQLSSIKKEVLSQNLLMTFRFYDPLQKGVLKDRPPSWKKGPPPVKKSLILYNKKRINLIWLWNS